MSAKFKTKIFLDSGDPLETKKIKKILGFIDGQTTNPSLIAKSPIVLRRIEKGNKFTTEEIYNYYKKIAKKIALEIPKKSVSLEIYADGKTKAEEILNAAREFNKWIPKAHIKIPITKEGLKAANLAVKEGINVNMTLCFNQRQAVAVYSATKGAKKGQVFISPFIGRLDDINKNGMDLISNILKLYKKGDGHVKVLAASIRSLDHLLACLNIDCDIVTVPYKILDEWKKKDLVIWKKDNYHVGYKKIPFEKISLGSRRESISIKDKLTDQGIEKFCNDWKALLKK